MIRDLLPPNLLVSMGNTAHNSYDGTPSPHHMEGSVLAHTLLVMEQAVKCYGENHYLYLASILHDIGKVNSEQPSRNGLHRMFSGHEGVSFYMAGDYYEMNDSCDLLLKVISCHGDLWKFKDSKEHRFADIRDKTLFEEVVKFSKLDRGGSILDDDLCVDESIRVEPEWVTPTTFDPDANSLTILIGPSGIGKSTLSNRYKETHTIISRDDLVNQIEIDGDYSAKFRESIQGDTKTRIENQLVSDFTKAVKGGDDIVVDMTNMTRKSRTKWVNLFKKYSNGKVHAEVLYRPFNSIMTSNLLRSLETDKSISRDVVLKQMRSFEFPKFSEGFDIIRINKEL